MGNEQFDIVNGILTKYHEEEGVTEAEIPDEVTSIGYNAFCHCTSLESIIIPENVTSIGNYVFDYCEKLTSITIKEGVKSIGADAFRNCKSLERIIIPEGVTSIGNYAFGYCDKLKYVEIPESVKEDIGNETFVNCKKLKSIIIRKNATSEEPGTEEWLQEQLQKCVDSCKISGVQIKCVEKEDDSSRKRPRLLTEVFDRSNKRYGKTGEESDYKCQCKDYRCWDCMEGLNDKKKPQRLKGYNCSRLCDYYVWRYISKYSAQIVHALQDDENVKNSLCDPERYPSFNILSLGCGDATDLMAFDYLKREEELTQPVKYLGLELEEKWANVQNDIERLYTATTTTIKDIFVPSDWARFERGIDVESFFKSNEIKNVNVLFIQYLLSIFYNKNKEHSASAKQNDMENWFGLLIEKIIKNKPKNKPMLIVITDVNPKDEDKVPYEKTWVEEVGKRFEEQLKTAGFSCKYYRPKPFCGEEEKKKIDNGEEDSNMFFEYTNNRTYHPTQGEEGGEPYQAHYLDCRQLIFEVE